MRVFRFAGSHLQMELLRDGSPGSSAEVCVSNTHIHTHMHTHTSGSRLTKKCELRCEKPLVNVMTLDLNRHGGISKHMLGNIKECVPCACSVFVE